MINYYEYIESADWFAFRKKVIDKQKKCYVCSRSNVLFNVHHKTYKNLGHEKMSDVVLLCSDCHHTLHELWEVAKENKLSGFYGYARRMRKRYAKARNKHCNWSYDNLIRLVKNAFTRNVKYRLEYKAKRTEQNRQSYMKSFLTSSELNPQVQEPSSLTKTPTYH